MFRTLLISMFLTSAALADTLYVPSEYTSIQDAIDAASDGDEILVGPGNYGSTTDSVINPHGKKIWIHSSDGPEVTIINGGGDSQVIVCKSGETEETVIEGLTVTGGYGTPIWQYKEAILEQVL